MTLPSLAISDLMAAVSASGELATGSIPILKNFSFKSG